jgi:branched-chain amino acid transport system substrate-binding protein
MKTFLKMLIVLIFVLLLAGCTQPTIVFEEPEETNIEPTPEIIVEQVEPVEEVIILEGEPVKIGLTTTITGDFAQHGKGFEIATAMAAEKVNLSGGIKGRPLELVLKDSRGDSNESAKIAQFYANDESILAEIGGFTSQACMMAAPIYEEAGLIQLSPTASHIDFTSMGEYIFSTMETQNDEALFIAEYVLGEYIGAASVGILFLDEDWINSAVDVVENTCEANDIKITARKVADDSENTFRAPLEKINKSKPDVLLLMMTANESAKVVMEVKNMGWDVEIVVPGFSSTDELIDLGGESVEGILSTTQFIIEDSDSDFHAFAQEFQEKAGFGPDEMTASAYDSVMILADAMEKADSLDRSSIRDSLAKTDGFQSLSGPVRFSENGSVEKIYKIIKVENAQWVAIGTQ